MTLKSPACGDRRHARREATRQAILDAAEEIVLDSGFKSLKSRALADRAGISERSLFNHFPNLTEVVLARVSSYLVRLLSEPTVPAGLAPSEIPRALERKVRESFEGPDADRLFADFLALGLRLSPELALGPHIIQTLADVAERLTDGLLEEYPELTAEQSITIRMYIYNLTMGIGFGLLRGANRMGVLDPAGCSVSATPDTAAPLHWGEGADGLTLAALREDLYWAFDQVASGRPTI